MRKNYLQWFQKGNEDELSMDALVRDRLGHPNTVCFLAQQLAEKYMKGLLIFYGIPFAKVHDLLQLETLILTKNKTVTSLHEDLVFLNGFYIETRYPGDYPEFSWKIAEQASKSSERVKNFVMDNINSHG